MDTAPTWLGTREAAAYLGVNLRTLYRLIDAGELSAYRFGRVIRVKTEDVELFLQSAKIAPGSLDHLYPESARSQAR